MNELSAASPRNATVARNMDARRQRILDAAGCMLATGGTDGLTVRALAEQAGVTVPTIYNLVGSKEAVVLALIEAALHHMEQALQAVPGVRGIARAQAAVRASTDLYLANPQRYAPVFRAMQDLQARPTSGSTVQNALGPLFRRAGDVFCQAVREAQEDGALHGRLHAVPLGHHMVHALVETFRLWGIGALPAPAARARAMYAVNVSLMADATKATRRLLQEQARESERALDT